MCRAGCKTTTPSVNPREADAVSWLCVHVEPRPSLRIVEDADLVAVNDSTTDLTVSQKLVSTDNVTAAVASDPDALDQVTATR